VTLRNALISLARVLVWIVIPVAFWWWIFEAIWG